MINYNEFAEKYKAKNPAYKDRDNRALAEAVIKKNPVYASKVSFDEPKSAVQSTSDFVMAHAYKGLTNVVAGGAGIVGKGLELGQRAIGEAGRFGIRKVGDISRIINPGTGAEEGFDKFADSFREASRTIAGNINKGTNDVTNAITTTGDKVKAIGLEGNEGKKRYDSRDTRAVEEALKPDIDALGSESKRLQQEMEVLNKGGKDVTQERIDKFNADVEVYKQKEEGLKKTYEQKFMESRKLQWSDLSDPDFLAYGIAGSIIENAPQMLASLYAGGAAGKAFQQYGKVATFLGQVGASTGFSTASNGIIEADATYNNALAEGKSEEDALAEANRTFERNTAFNSSLELAQMMLLFAPQAKFVSPWLKGLVTSLEIGGAGALEAGQERVEDALQEQSGNEDLDVNAVWEKLKSTSLSETDAISFITGALFQGTGNAYQNSREKQIQKAMDTKLEIIADKLPDDGQGGTAKERVERAIETTPDLVTEAAKAVSDENSQFITKARGEKDAESMILDAEQRLNDGVSRNEIILELASKVGTDRATEIVDSIPEAPRVEVDIPTANELLSKTPADIQSEVSKLGEELTTKTETIQSEIAGLKEQIKNAPNNSQEKLQLKRKLTEKIKSSRDVQGQYDKMITESATKVRDFVDSQLKDLPYTQKEKDIVAERIIDRASNPRLDVDLGTIIRNEKARFKPTSQATVQDIEKAVKRVAPSNDADRNKALVDDVLETIQNEEMRDTVSELSLDDVVDQVAKAGEKYQLAENVSRKPTGRAKIENIHKEDMKQILVWLDAVRSDIEPTGAVNNDVLLLAERYQLDANASPKRLARMWEIRINKSEKLSKMADEITYQLEQDVKKKKTADKRKETTAKRVPVRFDKQIRAIPLFKHIPIKMVESITDGRGRKAFGRFYNNMVEFTTDADITTIPHEAFHTFSQVALSAQERAEMYTIARKAYGRDKASDFDIEETLAQDFAVYFVTEKTPETFSEKLVAIFKKLADVLRDAFTGKSKAALEKIYKKVTSEDTANRIKRNLDKQFSQSMAHDIRRAYHQNPEGFTLRLFGNKIFEKASIGYQETMGAIKSMNLKKGELMLHEMVLNRPEFKDAKKFDSGEYKRTVLEEMLDVRVVESNTYADYGYENIQADAEEGNAKTYIIDTNYAHGVVGHFGADKVQGLHSHFRAGIDHGDGSFKVVEVQSDSFQRGIAPITIGELFEKRVKPVLDINDHIRSARDIIDKATSFDGTLNESNRTRAFSQINRALDIASSLGLEIDFKKYPKITEFVDVTGKDALDLLEELDLKVTTFYNEKIVGSEPTPEDKQRIFLSEQFVSMKNNWYELTLRTAISEGAKKGLSYVDFADTRTVANVEGYVGEQGQVTRQDGFGDDVPMSDAVVNDNVQYLGTYDAVVVETMHDNSSVGLVYSPDGNLIETIHRNDAEYYLREELEDNNNFADRFGYEIDNSFFKDILTFEEQQELRAVSNTGEPAETLTNAIDSENLEIARKAEEFKQTEIDRVVDEYDLETDYAERYGEDNVYHYFDKRNDQEYVAFSSEGRIEHVEAPYGNTADTDFELSSISEDHARIAAKYGVNEIDGVEREGDYYKALKKSRPDLEKITDPNGFTWWRTAITDEDRGQVPLYQHKVFSGKAIADELKSLGTNGGVKDYLYDLVSRENYMIEDVAIADIIANDPYIAEFIEKGKPRRPRGTPFEGRPIMGSNGEVHDGWSRIAQYLKNGKTHVEVYKGIAPAVLNGDTPEYTRADSIIVDDSVRDVAEVAKVLQEQALTEDEDTGEYGEIDSTLEAKMIEGLEALGYSNEWSDMQNDLYITTTTKDKKEAGIKTVSMAKALFGNDFPMQLKEDGSLVMYHGTTQENADSIVKNPNEGLFVSSSGGTEIAGVNGAGFYGDVMVEVVVDPRQTKMSVTGEFFVEQQGIETVQIIDESKVLYQLADEEGYDGRMFADLPQEEASIIRDMNDSVEAALYALDGAISMSEAGFTVDEYGQINGRYTTFPSWIPKEAVALGNGKKAKLRDKKLMYRVYEKLSKGIVPTSVREAALYEYMHEHFMSMIPKALWDQKVLNDYFIEQEQYADGLRMESLKLAKMFVKDVDARVAKLKKGEVKKVIRYSTGQMRTDTAEFSKKLKSHVRYYNRGYRTGFSSGAKEKLAEMLTKIRAKRDRNTKLKKLKSLYRRVKQATKTGAYLPIEYQTNLKALFEAIDMTTMRESTRTELEKTAAFFESQAGEVPKNIAEKLKRLAKVPVGKMTDAQLEELLTEATRVFENGVLKKKLLDTRDERLFDAKIAELVSGSVNLDSPENTTTIRKILERFGFKDTVKMNYAVFDPSRFADILDGGKSYSGVNFKTIVEPVRIAIDDADNQTNGLLAEAFEEIKSLGDTFSEEEMARIMYTSALEQDGEAQAEALKAYYTKYDFTSALTPKERGALETMIETFKEIRGQVAAVYEAEKNIPFPDNGRYFPFRYDRDLETFDIEVSSFDFNPTKTAQGFTMQRQNQVGRMLDINVFDTFARQVTAQVYYANVQPQLSRLTKIKNNKAYQSAIGKTANDYLAQYITDVSKRGNGEHFLGKNFLDTIRGNISTAILGYKLSTVMIQPSATFDAMVAMRKEFGQVEALKLIPGFFKMMFSKSALDAAVEQSRALQNRTGGQLEIYELRNASQGRFSENKLRRGWYAFKANAYAGIRFTDIRTAANVFEAFRKQYEKQGYSAEEAVARAEQMMMLSQSSANVVNRPQILNHSAVKFLLPFQTFVVNAFNNIRYDAISTEIKSKGAVRGTIQATLNLQFLVYALAYEVTMYGLIKQLFGDEEDDRDYFTKLFASGLNRIPGIGFVMSYDGSFDGSFQINNPAVQAGNDIYKFLVDFFKGEADARDTYKATKGLSTLLGVPGTAQTNQIINADRFGIGDSLNVSYDDRKNSEKREAYIQPVIESKEPITAETIEDLAEKIYGKDYTEGSIQYRTDKKAEVIKEIAIREKYGYDDGFINAILAKEKNADVKAYFARNEVDLKNYIKPVEKFGLRQDVLSDQLLDELKAIKNAPAGDKERIAQLALAENDEQKKEIISGDKNFAKRAFAQYKLLDKALYESI
jgi:hypothetical protein